MMDVTLSPVNTVPLLLLIAQSESWNICYCGAVRGQMANSTHTHIHTHMHNSRTQARRIYLSLIIACLIGGERRLKEYEVSVCTLRMHNVDDSALRLSQHIKTL